MTMTGRRPPTAPASATRRTPREAMAASVLPASRRSGAGGRLSAVEMTEGPFAYCENCTARRAGGGNNMSFSRALSGGTEMQVSASLRGRSWGWALLLAIPPRAAGRAATPPRPSSSPYCAPAVTQESLGPVGLLTPFCRRGKIQRGADTCPESHGQQKPNGPRSHSSSALRNSLAAHGSPEAGSTMTRILQVGKLRHGR